MFEGVVHCILQDENDEIDASEVLFDNFNS